MHTYSLFQQAIELSSLPGMQYLPLCGVIGLAGVGLLIMGRAGGLDLRVRTLGGCVCLLGGTVATLLGSFVLTAGVIWASGNLLICSLPSYAGTSSPAALPLARVSTRAWIGSPRTLPAGARWRQRFPPAAANPSALVTVGLTVAERGPCRASSKQQRCSWRPAVD